MPIKKLIEHEPVAELLKHMQSRFDPFRTLAVEEYELRHTTTLAWLLDETGSHELESRFLEAFLARLEEASGLRFPYASGSISVLTEVAVVRSKESEGWRFGTSDAGPASIDEMPEEEPKPVNGKKAPKRLDLLIVGAGWSVGIEAKIRAREGEDQLECYESALRDWQKTGTCGLFFLTLGGQAPSRDTWKPISWAFTVAESLRGVLSTDSARNHGGSEAASFVQHYVQLIERIADPKRAPFAEHVERLARDKTVIGLVEAAESYLGNPANKSEFNPLFLQHRWFIQQLFGAVQSMRANLAQAMLDNLEEAGTQIAWKQPDPSYGGSILFLPHPWREADGALEDGERGQAARRKRNRRSVPRSLAYKIEVKQGRAVELKLWLPPEGDRTKMKALWDRVAQLSGEPGAGVFLTKQKKEVGAFKKSGKLFTISFKYDEDYVPEPRWRKFLPHFRSIAAAQRDLLIPVLDAGADVTGAHDFPTLEGALRNVPWRE